MTAIDLFWISEARMLGICSLPRSTFQGWNRLGLGLAHPGGAYGLREVLGISLLAAARDHAGAEELVVSWTAFNESGQADELVEAVRGMGKGDRFELVLAPVRGLMTVARDDEQLVRAVRDVETPTAFVVIDVSAKLHAARDDFERFQKTIKRPQTRRPGRPKKDQVAQLHSVDSGV